MGRDLVESRKRQTHKAIETTGTLVAGVTTRNTLRRYYWKEAWCSIIICSGEFESWDDDDSNDSGRQLLLEGQASAQISCDDESNSTHAMHLVFGFPRPCSCQQAFTVQATVAAKTAGGLETDRVRRSIVSLSGLVKSSRCHGIA